MKLLARINRTFLVTATALLTIWCVIFYFSLRFVMYEQVDEDLLDERDQIIYSFQHAGDVPESHWLAGELVKVSPTSEANSVIEELRDTSIENDLEQEPETYRIVSFTLHGADKNVLVTLGESQAETDDLICVMLVFILLFVFALFAVLYFINRRSAKNLWLPFNDTLEKLKTFDISDHNRISFQQSGIGEFDELSKSLNAMTEKIYNDFDNMKRFTENASHEIQTPLSIIRSKIETLIQTENISEEQMNSIQQINEAASRLAKLNTSLITLTKIENNQFAETEEVQLTSFIRRKLVLLEEIIQEKKISVSMDVQEVVVVHMNASLADLLFDNLLANAIKHNIPGGLIKISVSKNQFSISNSGAALQTAPEKLFDRFVKNNPSSDSLGLGLAIVKQICDSCNFKINFTSEKNIHAISISF